MQVQRKRAELEVLSCEPISEISAVEALRLISERYLCYADAPEYFERWWGFLDAPLQQRIDAASENFRDWNDYSRRLFSDGAKVLNAPDLEAEYAAFVESIPTITMAKFFELKHASESNRKTVAPSDPDALWPRKQPPPFAKEEIEKHLAELRDALSKRFNITAGRETTNADRDRLLSQWRYQEMKPKDCAKKWNKERRGSKDLPINAGTVTAAVNRHRGKRERLRWILRVWIYVTKFPDLICHCQSGPE